MEALGAANGCSWLKWPVLEGLDGTRGELSERIDCCCNTWALIQVGPCQESTVEPSTVHYSATSVNKAAAWLTKIIAIPSTFNQIS